MRWIARKTPKLGDWYPWYAWYPVRIPTDVTKPGIWIWLEWVEVRYEQDYLNDIWHMRQVQEQTEAPRP